MKRWIWGALLALGLVLIGSALVLNWLVTEQTRGAFENTQSELAASFEAHRASFEADIRWYANSRWVLAPDDGPHEDAGTFLNPALSWDAAAAANPRLSLTGWEDRLDAEAWPELILSEDTPDTSWFAQLKRFERWRLDQESPQTDWFESPIETFEPAAMPLPDYRALRRWAKLRALEAAQGSSVLQAVAVEEIQHLARLMFSTDD
ncbi:MAG: hypothetical protein AAFY60_10610, partial [Myxococcota bacterium]